MAKRVNPEFQEHQELVHLGSKVDPACLELLVKKENLVELATQAWLAPLEKLAVKGCLGGMVSKEPRETEV